MSTLKLTVNRKYKKSRIDRRIFGSFVEHMGRVIYTGIYEKNHPHADGNGFRKDVLAKISEMGVTAVRYPGGNFVSNYKWMDGIGPLGKRPRKRDLAWKSIETNEFGIDEFMKWAGADYCMGMLSADADSDLLDPSSWKKERYPVFAYS